MPKVKSSLAKRIAELEVSNPKDFDPEEEVKFANGSGSEDESSSDENAGTEHYESVGKSKLRKPIEVALGPRYTGSKVSRAAAFADEDNEISGEESDEDDEVAESGSESEDSGEGPFAELDEIDIEAGLSTKDDDGEIDSDAAFAESDDGKFDKFTFRGSGKPRDAAGKKKRPTASDFMSDHEDEDAQDDGSEQDETDEDILDVDAQHADLTNDDQDSEDVEMDSDGGAALGEDGEEDEGEEDEDDNDDEDDDNESQSDQGSDTSLKDDESEEESDDEEDDKARRDELRALMGEEQQTVVAMSQALKADAAKGNAVRAQRKAFDQLLHTRMDLQKALIATNSLSAVEDTKVDDAAYSAAESAALKLWSTLDSLRLSLSKAINPSTKTSSKRKREVDSTTESSILWDRMQAHEVSMLDNRQTILDKWSSKVRGTDAQPITRKLNPTGPTQSLSSLLQDQLASSEHLIQRSKIPRSCAPLQRDAKLVEDQNIYDDGPFYQLLLKELVDQRRVESVNGSTANGNVLGWTAVKEVKARKNVDTKASKGRKMRYNVHEKLQNFMAPEDRGSWEEEAVGRFFGTLLGQKMTLIEEDGDADENDMEEVEAEEEGLKLFRS